MMVKHSYLSMLHVNGIQERYWLIQWLAEESDRILPFNISEAPRNLKCVGAIQTCTDSTSPCATERKIYSPTITIITTTGELYTITEVVLVAMHI